MAVLFRLGQYFDNAGAPLAGGKAYFRIGTTPTTAYAAADLTDPHPYPVVADDAGRFPPCYFAADLDIKCDITAADGDLGDPLESYPQIFAPDTGAIDGADIEDGTIPGSALDETAITDALTYTPANVAGDTFTGPLRASHVPTTIPDDLVGLRIAPDNLQDEAYALVISDAGKTLLHSSGSAHAWTIPTNASVAFPVGTVIAFANTGAGAVTLTRAGGVALRIGGASSDANVAVAQWGVGSLLKVGTDSWIVTGVNLS